MAPMADLPVSAAAMSAAASAIWDALDERQTQMARTCPNGCRCRYMTNDADRADCACDGPCCMDEDWWDGFDLHEVLAAAAALHLTAELAARYDVSITTVYGWNSRGEGPTRITVGGHVRYRPRDVEAWEAENTIAAETSTRTS